MLTEMPIPLSALTLPQSLAADVAHSVAADAGEFVAAAVFDEAKAAAGTGAFEGGGAGGFDRCAQGERGGLVAGVWVVPGFGAEGAGGEGAVSGEALEAGGEMVGTGEAGEGL